MKQSLAFQRSEPRAGNAKSFYFDKPAGFSYQAGQYQTWHLPKLGDGEKAEHWFTISAAPSEPELALTTRLTGSDFKRALDTLQPGDMIEVRDQEGDFTWEDDRPVVLVAGGIGITPFRSMLVERDKTGRPLPAVLVYANRDEEIVFHEELDDLAARHPEFRVHYAVGERLTGDLVLSVAPEAAKRLTYISGPEPMVEALGAELKDKGVEVKQDWFPGYDESNY